VGGGLDAAISGGVVGAEVAVRDQSKYGERVPPWLTGPISQLAEFDPSSDLFRYGRTKKPAVSQKLTNRGELWIDLRTLKKTMSLIEQAFIRVGVAESVGLEGLKRP
jgi:hypothetical protein